MILNQTFGNGIEFEDEWRYAQNPSIVVVFRRSSLIKKGTNSAKEVVSATVAPWINRMNWEAIVFAGRIVSSCWLKKNNNFIVYWMILYDYYYFN